MRAKQLLRHLARSELTHYRNNLHPLLRQQSVFPFAVA